VSAAAGTSVARGDTVEVQTVDQPAVPTAGQVAAVAPVPADDTNKPVPVPSAAAGGTKVIGFLAGILAVVATGAGVLSLRRPKTHVAVLSHEERAAALQQIKLWLEDGQHKEAA
jgi:hypothetical protein